MLGPCVCLCILASCDSVFTPLQRSHCNVHISERIVFVFVNVLPVITSYNMRGHPLGLQALYIVCSIEEINSHFRQ